MPYDEKMRLTVSSSGRRRSIKQFVLFIVPSLSYIKKKTMQKNKTAFLKPEYACPKINNIGWGVDLQNFNNAQR